LRRAAVGEGILVTRERAGILLCLASAAAFSTSTIFGRVALEDGVGVTTILVLRYVAAAPLFWLLVRLAGQGLPTQMAGVRAFVLGAVVVAPQAILIYMALARLTAGLVVLLLYTFPAMVAIGAFVTGREPVSWRKASAVAIAILGTALAMLGDGQIQANGVGVALALGSAFCCALWILIGDRVLQRMAALTVSALISTGAAVTLCLIGVVSNAVELSFGPAGWVAIVGTIVVAFATSLAGMARVGPTVASILLTAEVPLAVSWSILFLGEQLQPMQVVVGALVVAAVLLLQVSTIRWPAWLMARYAPRVGALEQPRPPT
jgi:drug/metabolite transporter (DMT)-like permease